MAALAIHARAGAAVVLALTLAGCNSADVSRPNVLLVTIDTLRADHCSSYGYAEPTTPRLDRLAQDGLLFETAYAPIPVTGPSHASLLTGLAPRAHGAVRNGYALDAARPTLGERLATQGYSTAAIVSAFPLDRRFGLARGFQHYDDVFLADESSLPTPQWEGKPLGQPYDRRAGAATARALRWLASRPQTRPFFLWVHYFDPHAPYDPPATFRPEIPPDASDVARRALLYDAEVRYVDAEMGRLIDAIDAAGLGPRTLVVVASDHGEGLGQHGYLFHGRLIYEEAVRVPLVIRWPGGVPAGRRESLPVNLTEVAPTILELAQVPGARKLGEGQGLPGLGRHSWGDPLARPIFLQNESEPGTRPTLFGLRLETWKYIEKRRGDRTEQQELYDLASDAEETRDLSLQQGARAALLAQRLGEWRRRLGPVKRQDVTSETTEGLRRLGYLDE